MAEYVAAKPFDYGDKHRNYQPGDPVTGVLLEFLLSNKPDCVKAAAKPKKVKE